MDRSNDLTKKQHLHPNTQDMNEPWPIGRESNKIWGKHKLLDDEIQYRKPMKNIWIINDIIYYTFGRP